jgi:hypothetical protein
VHGLLMHAMLHNSPQGGLLFEHQAGYMGRSRFESHLNIAVTKNFGRYIS